jgi:MFS family permease
LIQTVAVTGFIGKLVFGWAADRISLRLGLWLAQGLATAGIAILSLEPGYTTMLLAASLMGLAAGGMLPVWGAMVGVAFGVASYGRVMGLMMPVIAAFVVPGPILAALSMDETGSYAMALQGFVGVLILGAMLLIPLRLATEQPATEAA